MESEPNSHHNNRICSEEEVSKIARSAARRAMIVMQLNPVTRADIYDDCHQSVLLLIWSRNWMAKPAPILQKIAYIEAKKIILEAALPWRVPRNTLWAARNDLENQEWWLTKRGSEIISYEVCQKESLSRKDNERLCEAIETSPDEVQDYLHWIAQGKSHLVALRRATNRTGAETKWQRTKTRLKIRKHLDQLKGIIEKEFLTLR